MAAGSRQAARSHPGPWRGGAHSGSSPSTNSHACPACIAGPTVPGGPGPLLPPAQPQVTEPPLCLSTQLGGWGSGQSSWISPSSLSPQPFLESPAILRCESTSGGCHPSSCPPVAHPEGPSGQGEQGKGPRFTCLLGGGDWLKLLESLLSELWGMAPVSGSQGLFSFLRALGAPAFCLTSRPSPRPSSVTPEMALSFTALARSRGTLSSCPALCHFLCLCSRSLCTFPLGLGLLWFLRTLGM